MTERLTADVVIVGIGGLGSATAAELARRGRRVVAFDQFESLHDRGSSHGTERIVRSAYTDVMYTRLANEAVSGWRALEEETGANLINVCGGIDTGWLEELDMIAANFNEVGVPHEMLDVAEASRRFPGFRFEWPVLWQPNAATVHADDALAAFQRVAVDGGADLRFGTRVTDVEVSDHGVTVRAEGVEVSAGCVVITTGAWADRLVGYELNLPPLTVTDEQVFFFQPQFDMRWPTFITRSRPEMYGLPTPEGLVKAGGHYEGIVCDPDDRPAHSETARSLVSEWIAANVPWLDPEPVRATTCLYATYPDEDFVIDRVGSVVLGVGLGGHGFKFLPELGWRLADLCDGEGWAGNPFTIVREARHVGPSGHK